MTEGNASATSFMRQERLLFTSESVTEGHPDKLCDQVSDAVLDAVLAADPQGRVAAECLATTGLILVAGEITTRAYVDLQELVRGVLEDIGYTRAKYGFDARTCGVLNAIKPQSPDIDLGVSAALETRAGGGDALDKVGAGDQGMMIGFACAETPELMPLPITLAHRLAQRLAAARKAGELEYLRPDGKTQFTVEYEYGVPKRVDTVVVSHQHDEKVSQAQIARDVERLVHAVVPAALLDDRLKLYVNPTGRFVIGGPMGDCGLTGRKIIVDTYGGMARHGGGAFSGKDPTKVDRSGAYAARWVAKNLVAAGLAERIEIQLAYAIGVAHPVSVMVEAFGTERIGLERIAALVGELFDLRPGAIIRDLDLRRPIYRPTAAYGHFGRPELDLPWERTDKAAALRHAAGLEPQAATA
jgi:S-adenosylmethionine synthetase